jgi:hypothetical protein
LENSDSRLWDRTLPRELHSSYFYFFGRKMLAPFALVEDRLIGTWFAMVLPAEPAQPTVLTRAIFAEFSQPGIAP